MSRTLYELANVESPFVWRAKFALAHKGVAYDGIRTPFTEIPKICEGRHKTVPVLVEADGTEIADSWAIAEHLEATYPDAPTLFPGGGVARAKEVEGLLGEFGFPAFFSIYIRDIWAGLPDADAKHFRTTREARFGKTLEEIEAGRETRLPAARAGLDPLRDELAKTSWLHGEAPGYGDYIWLAFLAWMKGCATIAPFEDGDPIIDYAVRGFALHGGVAQGITAAWMD